MNHRDFTPPPPPANASDAAKMLLDSLPTVEVDGKMVLGYLRDGNPTAYPLSLDRSLAVGTLRGIADSHISVGDVRTIMALNAAFAAPLEEAIKKDEEAAKGATHASDTMQHLKQNRQAHKVLCDGIEAAASFGIFLDQTIVVNRRTPGFAQNVSGNARG